MEKIKLREVLPGEIEKKSFEIIREEMGQVQVDPLEMPVLMRAIHTSADFDYLENLKFSPGAVAGAMEAIKRGATIVTDTNMAKAGINKARLGELGGQVLCFMADEDVAERAKAAGTTRAVASMDKAAQLEGPVIFAIGNAPTALVRLLELAEEGKIRPELIIGAPVGFVNVVESKELLLQQKKIPYIVARGRKGGSNIAAAICNAMIYQCEK
ncbi:MAG: precorrin-8X methylmutase [Anaerovoracaceae bacterium]|jgi:precorrin-8X/cobalt-precorrin-8 methylmutase